LISTGLGTNKTVKEYLIVPNGDHYLATKEGIVAFNVENEVSRILTETSGNGNLSSNRINTFELGLDGKLWIGTADGVCYFTNYFGVFENTNVDAVRPIFDGFFLFDYTAINAIAIDGGNRLWVGNRDGLWLFDEDIEENLLHFTEENSPLANETVEQIRINPFNGEAFIKSGDQLISYRTASSRASSTHSDVKVFPNPVYLNQHDQVSINGLVFNNEIMITDLAGNLVYKGAANGGTFNWNLQNYSGFIAKPGIYLVFSVDTFGEETYQTKFVVSN
jgi:ligand-binding sensor domain-containing protein